MLSEKRTRRSKATNFTIVERVPWRNFEEYKKAESEYVYRIDKLIGIKGTSIVEEINIEVCLSEKNDFVNRGRWNGNLLNSSILRKI